MGGGGVGGWVRAGIWDFWERRRRDRVSLLESVDSWRASRL